MTATARMETRSVFAHELDNPINLWYLTHWNNLRGSVSLVLSVYFSVMFFPY
jgi:hypothetical protein